MIYYYINKFIRKLIPPAVKHSFIDKTSKIESGTSFIHSSMARHSFCGYDCVILNAEIGSFCSIASSVKIGGVAHPVHFVSTSPAFLSHRDSIRTKFARHHYLPMIKTRIGNDVWIGDGAFIKAGTNIGTGAIVGMGSVVTKNVEPYSIVAGNPARVIRKRFSDQIIEALLATEWWDKEEGELIRLGAHFHNPEKFLEVAARK